MGTTVGEAGLEKKLNFQHVEFEIFMRHSSIMSKIIGYPSQACNCLMGATADSA